MYPFKAVIIGDDNEILSTIRRELLNQYVDIDQEFPDIASAVENLKLQHDESRLFVCHLDPQNQANCLRRLSGAFAGRPIVALMAADANSSAVLHAMRDGVAQVVMLPLDAADFREAISSVALQFGHLAERSKVIAISGAHGGVGATTLAINLAYELSQTYQLDTMIAELSMNCGVLNSYLTIEPRFTTRDLLQAGHEIDIYGVKKALVSFGERLSILAGPRHAIKSMNAQPSTIVHLIQLLRQLARIVILDVPSTLDEVQLAALDASDEVVLVTDHTVPSLQMTAEGLEFGMRTHAPWIVVNRFDARIQGLDADHISKALAVENVRTVALDHDAITMAINSGQPVRLAAPKSKALADIDALAQVLLPTDSSMTKLGKNDRLLSRFAQALRIG